MPKLVTWMNNQRVGELTKLANGAHTFKYAPEWLASRYARPLSLSLPLQRGNITSDAVFNFFDNLLPDSPIVRDRIVKRYHAKSRQPFDLLSEIGRDSVGAVTLIPEDETVTHPIMAWENTVVSEIWGLVIVNEHDNHDRQRLDSSLVYIGAHNVYYVKSCLSDAKCFSGSRYSFRVQELKPLLFHNWPVHGEIAWLFPAPC